MIIIIVISIVMASGCLAQILERRSHRILDKLHGRRRRQITRHIIELLDRLMLVVLIWMTTTTGKRRLIRRVLNMIDRERVRINERAIKRIAGTLVVLRRQIARKLVYTAVTL